MKKNFCILLAAGLMLISCACAKKPLQPHNPTMAPLVVSEETKSKEKGLIISFNSETFDKSELSEAADLIRTKFENEWTDCTLHSIDYTDDDCNSKENIKWLNELNDDDKPVTKCMMFLVSFHSPAEPGEMTAWEPDYEYEDYQFWIGINEDGEMKIMSFGY